MAGYARQSSADIVATAVVRANPLNVEFNALRDTFALATGHTHDGSATEGGYVPLIADSDALNKIAIDTSNNRVGIFVEVSNAAVEQIRIQDGAIVPVTDSDIDLGTSSLEFKDLFLDGTAHIDTLDVDANAGIIGNLTVSGNTTLGDAASDTVTVTADVASPLIPSADDTYDLGASGSEWRNLYIDGTANIDALVADTADINGGTADGVVIGGSSAAAGTFTSLTATGTSTLTTVDINGGAIDGAIIGANSAAAITGTTITGTSLVGAVTGDVTGNADTATALETARTIGGVSFDGTGNINLPGVNATGNQATSGNAATATALETARTIGGVSFDGTGNINLPGVNASGNQDTSGNAATATTLATARTIAGQSFNGSANITIAATDLSDTDQSLATGDNVQFAQVTTTGNAIVGGSLTLGSTAITSTAAELNTLDGITAVVGELNALDLGSTAVGTAIASKAVVLDSNKDYTGIRNITTTGNAIIGGDLTVNGTTTTVDTTNMVVSDALIELGSGTTGTPSNDAGLVIERGDAANAFIGYDESADKFTVGTGTFTGASTGNLSITTGTLVANIEGNITGSSGSTTGNAATATALATARTIGGVSFDGTGNINLSGVNTTGNQDTSGNASTATALATARNIAGQSFDGTGNISIAPTDLTGVNSTAAELNIMDGDTSATSTTLADADRVVVNDAGTMKQVALTDFETYMETSLDTLSNVTTVGALNSGSITSGFGAIDVGSSAITTTGTINFGSLADGSITATGFVDEDNMSSNSATLIPTQQSVKAYVDSINGISNNVTGLNATGAELNTVADFSAVSVDTSTAIANNDALLVFDNGNEIGYRDVDLLDTYFSGTTKTLTNKTLTSPIVTGMHLNDSGFTVEGSGADGNETTVAFTNPTADRTITLPDATGNLAVFATAPTAAISDGSSGQFLKTDGSGALSFADAGGGASAYTIDTKTDNYTAVAGDLGKLIHFTQIGADKTLTLTAAATLGAGWFCYVRYSAHHSGPSYKVIIDPNGSETIDGTATRRLYDGGTFQIVCDGSNFQIISSDESRAIAHHIFYNGVGNAGNTLPQPDASGNNSVAIGQGSVASGSTAMAIGSNSLASGSGAIAGPQSAATGIESVCFGHGSPAGSTNGARGNYSVAIGGGTVASGTSSLAIGRYANATGEHSNAIGHSLASGSHSFAAGIASNSSSYGAQGNYSVALGYTNKAVGSHSIAVGRDNIVNTGAHYSVALGQGNIVSSSATNATSLGQYNYCYKDDCVTIGQNCHSHRENSFALGVQADSAVEGKLAYASGTFSSRGEAQGGTFILRSDTTDATAEAMTTNNDTADTYNQIVAASDTCITFHGTVVAMQNGAQAHAGWEIKGMLVNDGGTTTLALGNVSDMAATNASSWAVALSADNTNNALKIQVTGEASHNIRWVANVHTSEVTYA